MINKKNLYIKEDRLGNAARLKHIIQAIAEIAIYTENILFEDFAKNSMMLQACIRQLEIIGEASNRVSKEIQEQHTDIEWAKIISLRNLLIHEYFGVDAQLVWTIIKHNLPTLDTQIKQILTTM